MKIIEKLSNIKYPISNILIVILLFLGFIFRFYGLEKNYSFWSDEAHVAVFSRAILERGSPVLTTGFSTKIFQWGLYWTTAFSMKIFGQNELGSRLPIVIFGVLTIWAVYLLGKKLFGDKVGLLAAFFTAFLDIEILWSRQLRPYQVFQFFWVLGSYFSFKFLEDKNKKNLILAILCGLLSIIFHPLGVMFFASQLIFYIFLWLWEQKNKHLAWGIGLFLLTGAVFLRIVPTFFNLLKRFGQFNNFFYYRVFLTHNFLPLVIFSLLGFYFLFKNKKPRELVYFAIVLGLQTFAVSFLASQPFTRYFYPVFVFIILLSSYGILETGDYFSKKIKDKKSLISVFLVFLVVFSLWKTDKLSLFPKKIYSLNADMQEVPEVDWKRVYELIENKTKEDPEVILLANWNDLPIWHLGEGHLSYLIRKDNRNIVDPFSGVPIVGNFEDFHKILNENKKGLFVMDSWDDAVPDGVREYCQKNLKIELEIDRAYPVQPRYWTVLVYSWGIN